MLQNIFQNKLQSYCDQDPNIIQIGGNDGILDDPIYPYVCKYKLKLHVVEPIKKYYDELVINYKNCNNVITYNCAITTVTGKTSINYIDCTNSKWAWLKGCSSMYNTKNVLSGYMGKTLDIPITDDLKHYIKNNTSCFSVECFTWIDFLSLTKLNKIDIIVTDTEGEDFNIFNQIDFKITHPKLYYSEFYSLSKDEKHQMITKLNELNYICMTDGYNILAYYE
jgi:FkbM family methyltransferase